MNTPKSNKPAFELPIIAFPGGGLKLFDRAAGKTAPIFVGEEELGQLKSEPTDIQRT